MKQSQSEKSGAMDSGKPVAYTELRPGMCSNHAGKVRADDMVGVVDCTAAHRFEIVATLKMPDPPGAPYPGQGGLTTRAHEGCASLLRERIAANLHEIRYYFIATEEAGWVAGNRSFHCGVTTVEQVKR
ncbi:septum formation family protein [Embleya sp. NPDC056575]|uniref:septum formation family protein n=1 Tax=unclassified Embleya TaxID=2699296 RepID=UPI0036BAE5FC